MTPKIGVIAHERLRPIFGVFNDKPTPSLNFQDGLGGWRGVWWGTKPFVLFLITFGRARLQQPRKMIFDHLR